MRGGLISPLTLFYGVLVAAAWLLPACAAGPTADSLPDPTAAATQTMATPAPTAVPPTPTAALPAGTPFEDSPRQAPANRLFANVSQTAGLTFERRGDDKLIGQAWGDYDNDGWVDLYVTDSAGPNVLYHNNQDGTFSVSPLSGPVSLPDAASSGAIFADYDNDGWRDLFVLNVGANALFRNAGGRGFIDVTAAAGLGDSAHGKTAAWGDYDQDGYLDLYVANWSCSPACGRPLEGDKDRLYHNNGDGTFADVTAALSRPRGAGFVASFVDYDNDGDLDIYLVNDEFINPIGNVLWRNEGTAEGCPHWCFTDVSADAQADTAVMGMGLASADYDNDGDIDFYFSNAGPMALLQNQGDGTFAERAAAAGVDLGRDKIGWGAIFFDYDNDGWQDLYLAVSDNLARGGKPADALMQNEGGRRFTAVEQAVSGLDASGRTLGVACADYDNDGWLDLVVGNYDSGYVLYHNEGAAAEAAAENGRIAVTLAGGGPVNRDAIGSRVYVVLDDGRVQMQEVKSGSSLGAGDTLTLHFGLGTAEIVQLRIVWPDGREQRFESVPANRRYTFVYPAE